MSSAAAVTRPKQAQVWARDGLDWYVEPRRVTEALLRVERFVGPIWDPCAGQGNITAVLIAAGYDAIATDIVDRGATRAEHGWQRCGDFLGAGGWHPGAVNVVSNPPFFRAVGTEDFIRAALAGATGKVAVFVDTRFLSSQRRARGIYAERPPRALYVEADR